MATWRRGAPATIVSVAVLVSGCHDARSQGDPQGGPQAARHGSGAPPSAAATGPLSIQDGSVVAFATHSVGVDADVFVCMNGDQPATLLGLQAVGVTGDLAVTDFDVVSTGHSSVNQSRRLADISGWTSHHRTVSSRCGKGLQHLAIELTKHGDVASTDSFELTYSVDHQVFHAPVQFGITLCDRLAHCSP